MRDIARFKLEKAQAEEYPEAAKRRKKLFEWETEDRPRKVEAQEQALKKGELEIDRMTDEQVAREMAVYKSYQNDLADSALRVLQGKTPEERKQILGYEIDKLKQIREYSDHITSAREESVHGDILDDALRLSDEDLVKVLGPLAADARQRAERIKIPKGTRIGRYEGGKWIEEVPAIEETEKDKYEQLTIYGPGGQTKRIPVKKGEAYTPPEGCTLTKPTDKLGTGKERETAAAIAKLPELQRRAKEDPNKLYSEGVKLNDDGSVFIDPITGAPEKLESFDKHIGKRGMAKAIIEAGEHHDDALELKALLENPEVKKDLKAANDAGLWDRSTGAWSNKIKKWMAERGIAKNSKTGETIIRMQRMASNERKYYLGAAVTETELKSVLGWMPDAGDSYDTMINKINVITKEGEEIFRRFLDIYKNVANMSPFYKAFGIQRFPTGKGSKQTISQMEYDALIKKGYSDEQIKAKYEVK